MLHTGAVPVALDHGNPVVITSFDDGDDVEPGPQAVSGIGENGSPVALSVNGDEYPAVSVSDGRRSVDAELQPGENRIIATQRSRGRTRRPSR